MTSLVAGGLTLLAVFAAALGGLLLGRRLPEHHLDPASRDVVRLVLGIVATLSALVLGLLVASGKSSWDAQQGALHQMTAKLVAQQLISPIPVAFLAVLIAWLSILFAGFGLFAPANATVLAALFLGALSVAAAVFLVMELGRPFEGIMQISRAPLQAALLQLGR